MAQGKKTDIATKAKVIKKKLENTEKSNREIAREEWLSDTHVWEIVDAIPDELLATSGVEAKTRVLWDVLDSIIDQWNEIIEEFMPKLKKTIERYSDLKQISDIQEKAFKQKQLIGGKPTEIRKIDYSSLSDEELSALIVDAPESLQ